MKTEDLQKVVDEGVLPKSVAVEYLNLYLGKSDWSRHIADLYARLQKQIGEKAKEQMKQVVSCAIALPALDKSVRRGIDDSRPETLLFSCHKFQQFGERDWFAKLQDIVKEDLRIQEHRNEILRLGVIDPIDYQPYTRQAFYFLFDKAEQAGAVELEGKAKVTKSMENLVRRYGGFVVSSMFTKHVDRLDNVVNWRSGYFVERQIHKTYTFEQMKKIKQEELNRSPQKLVKAVA